MGLHVSWSKTCLKNTGYRASQHAVIVQGNSVDITCAATWAHVIALLQRCSGALVSVQASWISWHNVWQQSSQDWVWVASCNYTMPFLAVYYCTVQKPGPW